MTEPFRPIAPEPRRALHWAVGAALLAWLGSLTGDRLQLSPPDDPHAYALYFYSRPGDHIG